MFDEQIAQEKKDRKQSPNQYFKTAKKTDILDTSVMSCKTLYKDKLTWGQIRKSPKISYVDEIMKD